MRRVCGFFWLPIARPHGILPLQDRGFKEFRGFPDMELGIFRVAKSSGGGRLRRPRGSIRYRNCGDLDPGS